MSIDFTCQKCDGGFEIEAQDLLDGSEKLECPHCGARASQAQVDDFTAALTEVRAQVTSLAKKFALSFTVDSEDLAGGSAHAEEDDEDEDEDDDDDLDEDEDDVEDDDADD